MTNKEFNTSIKDKDIVFIGNMLAMLAQDIFEKK